MRVLIVEDEYKIAKALKDGLGQENFVADVAGDGEEGYDLASTEDYAVIILDLMLPKMDGVEVCKRLRSRGIHTPILMLTAKGGVEDRVAGLNSGADDYLSKPFAFVELLARVKALARRPRKSVQEKLQVEDLHLDSNNFQVKRGKHAIELSRKEFSLLHFLMRNPGKIITKEQIIRSVWDYDADILPNTVEVYIGYLRNKIDRPFTGLAPVIHTVRGFGYKIGRK